MAYWVVRNRSGHTSIARCTRRTVRVSLSLSRLFIATLLTTGRHVRRVSPPSFPPWRLDPHPWRGGGSPNRWLELAPPAPLPKCPSCSRLFSPTHAMRCLPPLPQSICLRSSGVRLSLAPSPPQGGGDGTREISKVESI